MGGGRACLIEANWAKTRWNAFIVALRFKDSSAHLCFICIWTAAGASTSMSSHGGSQGASRLNSKQSAKASGGSSDHVLQLVSQCKDAFSSFKPSMTTVDAHIDE